MPRDLTRDPVRFGILGCGSFMQRRILTSLANTPQARAVNLMKRNIEEARAVAEQFDVSRAVDSRNALLNDPDVEIIWIGTPPAMHEEDVVACATAGKPVLCEKPLSPDAEGSARMISAMRDADLLFQVGQSCRFKESVRTAQSMLESGKLGELRSMRGFFAVPPPEGNWRFDWGQGGGAARDVGVHIIDLFRFVSGREIESVVALSDTKFDPDAGRADRSMRAIFRMEGGVDAEMTVSFNEPPRNGWEVHGSKASLFGWHSLRQTMDPWERLHLHHNNLITELSLKACNIYEREIEHAANVLVEQTTSILDANEGLRNQQALDAVYASALGGRRFTAPIK